MPVFTIETTYRLPIYRHRVHVAHTLEEACRRAIGDDDWRFERRDYDSAGPTYVSGAWRGPDMAYRGQTLAVPPEFDDPVQRKADQFPILFALLKKHGDPGDPTVRLAIAEAESIPAETVPA